MSNAEPSIHPRVVRRRQEVGETSIAGLDERIRATLGSIAGMSANIGNLSGMIEFRDLEKSCRVAVDLLESSDPFSDSGRHCRVVLAKSLSKIDQALSQWLDAITAHLAQSLPTNDSSQLN